LAHAPEFYRNPSNAASPASTIQITRAMATVSRMIALQATSSQTRVK